MTRYATPHPDSEGTPVLWVQARLTEEQTGALLDWADGVWGEDLVVEGSSDGTLVIAVPHRREALEKTRA